MVSSLPANKAGAEASWLKTENLSLNNFGSSLPKQENCSNTTFKIEESHTYSHWPYYEPQRNVDVCAVQTPYGWADNNSGYFLPIGGNLAGKLTVGGLKLYAIPNSNKAFIFTSPPYRGLYYHLVEDIAGHITPDYDEDEFTVTYSLDHGISKQLTNSADELVAVDYSSMSFSRNQQWMAASVPSIGLARISMEDLSILPFDDTVSYNIGVGPAYKTTVSDDGQFAAASSSTFHLAKIYDLSTCNPSTEHEYQNCQSQDLWSFLNGEIDGFRSVYSIDFVNSGYLVLGISYKDSNGQYHNEDFGLTTGADVTKPGLDYLGLGDSFASGEGAFYYRASTDTDNNKCHNSLRSYPYLLGQSFNLSSYGSVACSGAIVEDVDSGSSTYTGQVDGIKREDRNSVNNILASFLPGYISQLEFVNKYHPGNITVSAIGNDIGFGDKIKRCMEPDTCYSSYEDRVEIIRQINGRFYHLVNMYESLRQADLPGSHIYAIGYPYLAKSDDNCANNVHLNNNEIGFSRLLVDYLNSVIEQAANRAGVRYVDVTRAFEGHLLCETAPPNVAVNGLTLGDDKFIVGNESFHPNAFGHELLASAISEATGDFTQPMPNTDPEAKPPAESDDLPMLQAPKTGRKIYTLNHDKELGNNIIFRNKTWSYVADIGKHLSWIARAKLEAAKYVVSLFSTPVSLGEFTTDMQGLLHINTTIPEDTPIGFHGIHIRGTDPTGQPIDIYSTIYVADTPEDWDGDGIQNEKDVCQALPKQSDEKEQPMLCNNPTDTTLSSGSNSTSAPADKLTTSDNKDVEAGSQAASSTLVVSTSSTDTNVVSNNSGSNNSEVLGENTDKKVSLDTTGAGGKPDEQDNKNPSYNNAKSYGFAIVVAILLPAIAAGYVVRRKLVFGK